MTADHSSLGADWRLLTRDDRVMITDQRSYDGNSWSLVTPGEVGFPPGFLSPQPVWFRRELPIAIPFLTDNGFRLSRIDTPDVDDVVAVIRGEEVPETLAVLKHKTLPGVFALNLTTHKILWTLEVFYEKGIGSTLSKRSEVLTLLNLLCPTEKPTE